MGIATSAYELGRQARKSGVPRSDNPHAGFVGRGVQFREWERGWTEYRSGNQENLP